MRPFRFVAAKAARILLGAVCAAAAAYAADWKITTIDVTNAPGSPMGLALLPSGQPAVSYYGGPSSGLEYAFFDGTQWSPPVIVDNEGNAGEYNSLAIVGGQPAISYHANSSLWYASFDGVRWNLTSIEQGGGGRVSGLYTSLAVLPNGAPAISYHYTVNTPDADFAGLSYAFQIGGKWNVLPVVPAAPGTYAGEFSSLVILPSGQPAVAFYSRDPNQPTAIQYASFDGNQWLRTTVDDSAPVTGQVSLALVDGQPAVSYARGAPDHALMYARFNGASWQPTVVHRTGAPILGTHLAVRGSGQPAIGYAAVGTAPGALRYAWLDRDTWDGHTALVDSGGVTCCSRLIFLPSGQPAITYHQEPPGLVKFATLEADCNRNGIPDSFDLAECRGEPWCADCNRNNTLDECDIASGFSRDLNQNLIPDECEPDCNHNGIPDELDIQRGTSRDCNGNRVPDECEPDTDGDGVIDACDGCPNDRNKTAPGVCGCGVPDTDSDGDGTPDCKDGCPNDPRKITPGDCGCGVPDTDSDGDGTPDCKDGCPGDPRKITPGDCGCGVPDIDTDGDGVNDCKDRCPNDPAKTAPGTCGCGVADADTDADGVPDCGDNCRTVYNPEQADGDADGIGDACEEPQAGRQPPEEEESCFMLCLVRLISGQDLTRTAEFDCDCFSMFDRLLARAQEEARRRPPAPGSPEEKSALPGAGAQELLGSENPTAPPAEPPAEPAAEEHQPKEEQLAAGAGLCPATSVLMLSLTLAGLLRSWPVARRTNR